MHDCVYEDRWIHFAACRKWQQQQQQQHCVSRLVSSPFNSIRFVSFHFNSSHLILSYFCYQPTTKVQFLSPNWLVGRMYLSANLVNFRFCYTTLSPLQYTRIRLSNGNNSDNDILAHLNQLTYCLPLLGISSACSLCSNDLLSDTAPVLIRMITQSIGQVVVEKRAVSN